MLSEALLDHEQQAAGGRWQAWQGWASVGSMDCFQSRRRAALFALGLIGAVEVGCRSRAVDQDKRLPAEIWSVEQPLRVTDDSLSIAEYRALGIPSTDRTWGADEIVETGKQLERLIERAPGALPRHTSAKSEQLFGRMTNSANLTSLRDSSVPLSIRLPAVIEFMRGMDALYRLYLDAFQLHHVCDEEMVELQGARLRTIEVVLELLQSSMNDDSPDEQQRVARRSAADSIRDRLTEVLSAMLRSTQDPRNFGVTARKKLIEYCQKSLPSILPKLNVKGREELVNLLDELHQDPQLANLQPQLGQLSNSAAAAVLSP
jgi:hypothetical protein